MSLTAGSVTPRGELLVSWRTFYINFFCAICPLRILEVPESVIRSPPRAVGGTVSFLFLVSGWGHPSLLLLGMELCPTHAHAPPSLQIPRRGLSNVPGYRTDGDLGHSSCRLARPVLGSAAHWVGFYLPPSNPQAVQLSCFHLLWDTWGR